MFKINLLDMALEPSPQPLPVKPSLLYFIVAAILVVTVLAGLLIREYIVIRHKKK